jgi:hypothetical protein
VTRAFIAALEPAKLAATLAAANASGATERPRSSNGALVSSGPATRRAVPSAAIAPSIPITDWSHAGLQREWQESLGALQAAKSELARRERELSKDERDRLLALGCDLASVWWAATTTPRDRKELL